MNAPIGWMDQFKTQVEAAGGRVVVCGSREEAGFAIGQELSQRNVEGVHVGGLGAGWVRTFQEVPVFRRVKLLEGPVISPDGIPEVGVGEADYAIAETGTLVEIGWGRERHLLSLLPPVHIALLAEDRILPDLDAFFTVLPPLLCQGPRPRIVFITGPSRSADIEKLLILGAHGPRELIVVVYPPPK